MASLDGKTLGPYRVIAQIGKGGMATIYRAYQPAMDRTVALKILPEHFAHDPQFVERFYREARTIAQLEHPNILPVYDFGEQDGITYLVMRFLDGGTLQELMEKQPLSLGQTSHILTQVCAALDYAHRKGIIHRDVKPSNVMIDREGAVYLSDFGIAKVLESSSHLTQTGAVLGTPAYMSPEQCMGSTIDKRSDIYSLGVMLYEMAVGVVPFKADTPMAVMMAHMHDPLPMPRLKNPAISEELQLVILKAMAKEPGDRFQTAAELAAALRRAAPVEEAPPPAVEPKAGLPPAVIAQSPGGAESQAEPTYKAPQVAAPVTPRSEPTPQPAAPVVPPPLPASQPPAKEPRAMKTVQVTGMASKKGKPAQQETGEASKGKKSYLLILGLGLLTLVVVAILARSLFSSKPGKAPQTTAQSLAAQKTQLTQPALAASPLPVISPTARPVAKPLPTNTPKPIPILIDSFSNSAFDGKLNPDRWSPTHQDGCQALQREGVLSVESQPRPSALDCSAGITTPPTRGVDLASMEASFRVEPGSVGDGQRTALAWNADLPPSGSVKAGNWVVMCGVDKQKDPTVGMWIVDTRMGDGDTQSVYSSVVPILPGEWSRLRLQVEPDTMTFSCFRNGQLVGMYNPVSEQQTLKTAIFYPHLHISRPAKTGMNLSVDDLVFLPPALVPHAADQAKPAPGCLPPPPGIVGWWTGDGALNNLVSPARGQGQGAWGFAKGMVGQAIAFQNFPSRGGVVYIPSSPQLNSLQNASVEGWVLIDSGPYPKQINRFLTMGPETLVIRIDGYQAPGALHFYIKVNGELYHIWSKRLLKAGTFYHVAGTYDGASMKLYINGELVGSNRVVGKFASADNSVSLSGGETMDGLLDEFTLYNRALNIDEIKAIYQAGAAGKCRP
jgi:serine/threonine protein kinase